MPDHEIHVLCSGDPAVDLLVHAEIIRRKKIWPLSFAAKIEQAVIISVRSSCKSTKDRHPFGVRDLFRFARGLS